MKKIKNLVVLILTVGFAFLFTGCFEIMNYVTVGDDNTIESHVKLSAIKKEEVNTIERDFPQNPEWEKTLQEEYGITRTTQYVSNEYSDGVHWTFNVPNKMTDEPLYLDVNGDENGNMPLSLFVPCKDGDNYIFSMTDEVTTGTPDPDPDIEMMKSMLGTVNYNMIFSKKFISKIKNVYVTNQNNETETYLVDFLDLGDAYQITLPLVVLFEKLGTGEQLVIEREKVGFFEDLF